MKYYGLTVEYEILWPNSWIWPNIWIWNWIWIWRRFEYEIEFEYEIVFEYEIAFEYEIDLNMKLDLNMGNICYQNLHWSFAKVTEWWCVGYPVSGEVIVWAVFVWFGDHPIATFTTLLC